MERHLYVWTQSFINIYFIDISSQLGICSNSYKLTFLMLKCRYDMRGIHIKSLNHPKICSLEAGVRPERGCFKNYSALNKILYTLAKEHLNKIK